MAETLKQLPDKVLRRIKNANMLKGKVNGKYVEGGNRRSQEKGGRRK
jgi:hypothetical protein